MLDENEDSPESSRHTSEQNEHSSEAIITLQTKVSIHLIRTSCHTSEENKQLHESSRQNLEENGHSPETSVHILASSEENNCGLEIPHLDLSRCPLLHKSLQPPQTERVVIQPESSGWKSRSPQH